jgi:mono/diheme cytochrome c family protein
MRFAEAASSRKESAVKTLKWKRLRLPGLMGASALVAQFAACATAPDPTVPTTADPPTPPKDATAARGELVAAAEKCGSCHQEGDGGAGALSGQATPCPGTKAYPANLTPDIETGLGGWPDDAIVRAIRDGTDDDGLALCPTMPRYTNITDDDAAALVAYLRSLAPVKREIPASTCTTIVP